MMKLLLSTAIAIPALALGTVALWQIAGDEPRSLAALGGAPVMKEAVPLGWRGGWSPEMTYQPGEVVTEEGSSYVAQAENVDVRPRECVGEDACAWSLLAIQGPRGSQGALGPAGAQGPSGLQGPAGTPGAVKGYQVVSSQGAMGNWDSQVHSVKCPAGKVPVGGGGMTTSDPVSGAQPGEKYLAVSRPLARLPGVVCPVPA